MNERSFNLYIVVMDLAEGHLSVSVMCIYVLIVFSQIAVNKNKCGMRRQAVYLLG